MPTAALRSTSVLLLCAAALIPASGTEVRRESAVRAAPLARFVVLPDEGDLRVTLEGGRTLVLLVRARAGDTFESVAYRYCGDRALAAAASAENPGRAELLKDAWYRLPLELLTPTWRGLAVQALFPADGPGETGWVHRPRSAPVDTYGEGAWEAALWFTGDGQNFDTILRVNALSDPLLSREAEITIPGHLLLEPFRSAWENRITTGPDRARFLEAETPPANETLEAARDENPAPGKGALYGAEPSEDSAAETRAAGTGIESGEAAGSDRESDLDDSAVTSPGASVAASELGFSKDTKGPYALYRIKRGEALYSAVVIRFTGRLDPEDVSEAAAVVAKRSGIPDVTGIPVGFAVKIPRDMILPEFLPPSDHKRQEVEADRKVTAKIKNAVRSRNLEGIHVILDAGHGGIDPGAMINGLSEHEYAYDVMCRIKGLLETTTAATVHPTIEDPILGFTPRPNKVLRPGGGERILTNPWHVNGDPSETSLGVNLRWYLANSIERRVVGAGSDPARTVFASIHADVLHPSLRGAMVYVPGERYRRGSFSCRGEDCDLYAEVREAPTIRFSRAERLRSEGLSRQFARRLVTSLRDQGVAVHSEQPVRDRVIRRGRDWLPAVLRGNSVPVKVLLEIVNLNNPTDRARLQDSAYRQAIAQGFVDALLDYYRPPLLPAARTASGATGRLVARRQARR